MLAQFMAFCADGQRIVTQTNLPVTLMAFICLSCFLFLSCDFMDLEVAAKGTATTSDETVTGDVPTIIREATTKLLAPDAGSGDQFGSAISISGDYAIVGAENESDGGSGAGAAYIFHRTGTNTWDSGAKVVSSDIAMGDQFGRSVSINGDYAIVGAYADDGLPGNPANFNAGAAYIFHRTGINTWDAGVKIVSSDLEQSDYFGITVSIDGDYAIIGAWGEGTGGSQAGAAYIFHRTGTNIWDTGVKIMAADAQASTFFGSSVAISGDYVVVGADSDDAAGSGAGAAYVFRRTGTNSWDSGVKILAPDAEAGDSFGESISISGDYILVGADYESTFGGMAGAAYFFRRTGTNSWSSGFKITTSDIELGDHVGVSVSISGNYAIIGADYEDSGGDMAGAAYTFNRTGTNTWTQEYKIVAFDRDEDDRFGISVSTDGVYAIMGARSDESAAWYAGSAYVFVR